MLKHEGGVMLNQIKSYNNSVRDLLKSDCLEHIIFMAKQASKSKEGDIEFSEFQQSILQKSLPGFTYQFCSTSTATTSATGALIDITSVNLNLPDDVLLSYLANHQYDELTPLVYANPGRCLNYTHVCRQELVKDHPMFINHCHKYGIHHDLSVGYIYPGHERTFIVFDYMGDEHNKNWAMFNHVKLELLSFPFALAWLYRNKKFDLAKLERMMFSLEGLTEGKFLNLRKYINSPRQSLQDQAADLGIKYGTLKDSLSEIRNQILDKTGETSPTTKNVPLRALEEHYNFLRMLGDNTTELKPALRPPFWGA